MKLYLRLSAGSLSMAQYELGREPYFAFSTYRLRTETSLTVNLQHARETEEILSRPTSGIEVLVTGPVVAVPLADFREEDCDALYNYCFASQVRHRVFYDTLPLANAILLFALDEDKCTAVEDVFGEVHYRSAQTAVLRYFGAKGIAGARSRRLFVHLHERQADIAVFDGGRLLFVNTFDVREEADVAYYVFNAVRHVGMDVRRDPIFVIGAADLRTRMVNELGRFAQRVVSIDPHEEFNHSIVTANAAVPYDMVCELLRLESRFQ